MSNKLPPLSLPYTKVNSVTHRGKAYARYVSDADHLLHALSSSPSRQLDSFSREWSVSPPAYKGEIARRALEPRWLATDVAKNACALSARKLAAIVDENLEALRGLIRVDTFVDHETGELHQALTLRGAAGVNAFLVMAVKQSQPLRGLYRGCVFVKRIAPVLRAVEEPAAISALVTKIDAACAARTAWRATALALNIPLPAAHRA